MKLYFLRHGPAEDREAWRGADFDRPLTEKGRERMAREAKRIADLELGVDLILTSPLIRAKQTAHIVADRLDLHRRLIEDERVDTDFSLSRLAAMLAEHPGCQGIMLVGHEPSMSETLGQLVGSARIDLKKGGIACVDLPEPSSLEGQLVWLIAPKILLS